MRDSDWGAVNLVDLVDGTTAGFLVKPEFLEGSNTYNLVDRLPNIKRLKVHGFSDPFGTMRLRTLNQLTDLESLEMADVTFGEAADLLEFLSPMVQLKQPVISSLYLDLAKNARAVAGLHDATDPVPKALQSHSVTFNKRNVIYLVMWLLGGTFDLTGLTDLGLTTVGPRIKKLQFCIPLHLQGTVLKSMAPAFKAFSYFKQLAIVEFRTTLDRERNLSLDLKSIVPLTAHNTFPNLWKIQVSVRLFSVDHGDYSSVWSDFDAHFSGPNFPHLREFVICGTFLDEDDVVDDLVLADISSMIRKCMPTLASRGYLKFERKFAVVPEWFAMFRQSLLEPVSEYESF
ncbi:uncharacterized protein EV420DRAFT_1472536 [Desarmillaria tabescens]|uniref:Uncharacterized protein n=1 Tax=Armillaria tabescens TaxID=1929756 RepID=A0AA39NPA2_ARMTA|nr:uncharacterized protein EV420DRAFT_1472536 [Desarmillaria tabescens]KAK0469281.1 hypothetical protein EV420DRAFT_1472536 [Desarmillaria tabescens]